MCLLGKDTVTAAPKGTFKIVYAERRDAVDQAAMPVFRGSRSSELARQLIRSDHWRMFKMNDSATPITITLRIPGQWSHPRELSQRLPAGCRLTAAGLILPDTTQVAFGALAADDQFAQIFRSACRQPAMADE